MSVILGVQLVVLFVIATLFLSVITSATPLKVEIRKLEVYLPNTISANYHETSNFEESIHLVGSMRLDWQGKIFFFYFQSPNAIEESPLPPKKIPVTDCRDVTQTNCWRRLKTVGGQIGGIYDDNACYPNLRSPLGFAKITGRLQSFQSDFYVDEICDIAMEFPVKPGVGSFTSFSRNLSSSSLETFRQANSALSERDWETGINISQPKVSEYPAGCRVSYRISKCEC